MSWLGPINTVSSDTLQGKTPYNATMQESGTSMRMTQEDVSCIFVESVIKGIWFVAWRTPAESNSGGPMRRRVCIPWVKGDSPRCTLDPSTERDAFGEAVPCNVKG